MEERPPRVTRHRSPSPAGGALAALGGVILGVGVLAALAFALVGRGDDANGTPYAPSYKILLAKSGERRTSYWCEHDTP